jgi:hypothetical protein
VGAAGVSLGCVTAGALVVSSVAAGAALRRARLTRGATLWLPIWSAAGLIELVERADVCMVVSATVSAPVGAATFRVRLVRRGGRRVS